jgi:MFS family permease
LKQASLVIGRLAGQSKEAMRCIAHRMPWYIPAQTIEGRNVRNLYTETAWFGILSGLADTFVSVFALRLGATTAQVGWLTALPALINVVWLIPAARIIERQHRRLPIILFTGLLQRLGYLAMAIMPFLVATGRIEALIIINTVIMVPTAIINTAVTSLLPDLTAPERRGTVVSVRWLILSGSATVAALAGGWLLGLMPVPINYQVLLGTGAACSLLSLYYLRRIRVPDAVLAQRDLQPRERYNWKRLQQSLSGILSHNAFVRFTLASFVFYWGLYLPGALWSVMRVRELGASDAWIGLIVVVIDVSTIGGYFYWGKIRNKRGDRWLLIVTAFGVVAYALSTAAVPTIAWMIPTSILSGVAWSGCNLALFNVMLNVCPDEHRASYIALYTALINITAFVAPLLGAALSDWAGIRIAFVVSGGVRLAGAVLFIRLLR